jgi:glycerol-3-phosphate acyltransferase PlsY
VLGSLLASVSYPILFWFLMPESLNRPLYMGFAIAMMILSFFCHRANIVRLLKGKENRLDFHKISKISSKLKKK